MLHGAVFSKSAPLAAGGIEKNYWINIDNW
jgi:hypothetical protein